MWWELSPLTLSRLTGDCTMIRYLIIKNLDEDEEPFEEDELAGEIRKWRTGGEWVGWT